MLAGVSLDHYTRIERGNIGGASEAVLNAIADALQLGDIERSHLLQLAHNAPTTGRANTDAPRAAIRPSVQRVIDSMSMPAVVNNSRQDLVTANAMGRALYSPHLTVERPNFARFIFLDSRAETYYVDIEQARRMTAATLRLSAGRNPLDEELTALIGELATVSPSFRTHWASNDVHEHRTGRKQFIHPEVGMLDLTFDAFEMPGEPGLKIVTYSGDEGSETEERLALLGSWVATGR